MAASRPDSVPGQNSKRVRLSVAHLLSAVGAGASLIRCIFGHLDPRSSAHACGPRSSAFQLNSVHSCPNMIELPSPQVCKLSGVLTLIKQPYDEQSEGLRLQ